MTKYGSPHNTDNKWTHDVSMTTSTANLLVSSNILGSHVPKWNTLNLTSSVQVMSGAFENVHGFNHGQENIPSHPFKRSGEFMASPHDPGLSRTKENLLTPPPLHTPYRNVYFQGAYRGYPIESNQKTRRQVNRYRSPKDILRNSHFYRTGVNIKDRLLRGTQKIFFRNNLGGISGSTFNSPSFGMCIEKDIPW